jgi:hypothetical protein
VSGQNFSQDFTITQQGTALQLCNLFGDDFNDGSIKDWATTGGTWQIVKGKLQIGGVFGTAIAQHILRSSSYFRLSADIEYDDLNGILGFYPFSSNQTYLLDSGTNVRYTVNGMGAGVSASGQASFLFYDMRAQIFRTINAANYGPVSSLAIVWTNSSITLWVNGVARSTLTAANFGLKTLPAPIIDGLSLVAMGEGTLARFDNVCEGMVLIMGLPSGTPYGNGLPMLRGVSSWANRLGILRAHGLPTTP